MTRFKTSNAPKETLVSKLKALAGFQEERVIDPEGLRKIGNGAMSEVYHATDRMSGRELAIKIALTNASAKIAIRNEARVLKSVRHPNIVEYAGSGVFRGGTFDGRRYLATVFLDAETLKTSLERRVAFPWGEARAIALGLSDGLQSVHEQNIIHLDIKPDNILMEGATPRIIDFGVASTVGFSIRRLLTPHFQPGDIRFVAPEFFSGSPDIRSDVFSVGAVLYTLVAGRAPLEAEEAVSFMVLRSSISPKPLGEIRRLPAGAELAVMRAISPDPDLRYSSMGEFHQALLRTNPD